MRHNPKVEALRSLAEQFPPDWAIPQAFASFTLPEYEMERLFDMGSRLPLDLIRLQRAHWEDQMEDINSGVAYERPNFFGEEWPWIDRGAGTYVTGGSQGTTLFLDRCEAYAHLWWIDVLIAVHTTPLRKEDAHGNLSPATERGR